MFKAKYQKVNRNEHEILIGDFDGHKNTHKNKATLPIREKTFDFTSINDYSSIFDYKSKNTLYKHNEFKVEGDTKPLKGIEKFLNLTIIGSFYLFFLIFLPFSLLLCLKKVKQNERIVVYRLGRIKSPAYTPGYCVLFPLIDSYHRYDIVQREFCIPNLQILSYENAIVDISTLIRYRINDVIKMTNSVQDLNSSLKSIARGILFTMISKKDTNKVENEKSYLTQELQVDMNEAVRKWGIEIILVELTINSIVKDESNDSGDDPALRSLSLVFKSLFNNSSSSSTPAPTVVKNDQKASESTPGQLPPELMSMFQGMAQFLIPEGADLGDIDPSNNPDTQSEFDPFRILKQVEPLITDGIVSEIKTVYEFHIKKKSQDPYKNDSCEIYHLDLKNASKSRIGEGPCLISKTDCIVKLSDEDLRDLLTDNLKPFTAYLSGRIEIEGDLQDVFKLKKLIKLVTNILPKKV